MARILNADKLIGEKAELTLGGKTFDVTKIPARTSFLSFIHRDAVERYMKFDFTEEDYNLLIEILLSALKPSNPEITFEWLDANLSIDNFSEVFLFVMEPALKAATDGAPGEKKTEHLETSSLTS
jgi:hypothetical protein